MILPVDIHHHLSVVTPVLAQWHNRCMNKAVMAQEWRLFMGPIA